MDDLIKNISTIDIEKYRMKGIYWHNQEDDIIRYEILRKMGYDVLVVTSDEYNRNKKSEKIIKKCNNFLTC